jgi:hypothetical protein
VRLDEQIVEFGQCLNAPLDGAFKPIGRIGSPKIYGGLDSGEDILGSVYGFASESGDVLVVPLSLRYILEAVDSADKVFIAIPDWLDVNQRDATRAVRPLNVDFLLVDGNAGAQHIGHGTLMVREQTAVRAEHAIRSAKPFIGIAEYRRPAP